MLISSASKSLFRVDNLNQIPFLSLSRPEIDYLGVEMSGTDSEIPFIECGPSFFYIKEESFIRKSWIVFKKGGGGNKTRIMDISPIIKVSIRERRDLCKK